ncbi:MAG: hypothetical protein LBH21_01430 [Gracilibacteraceae bacterium]|jgi:hypothetical protein|nr:hypothetical protein [Gracilibacteraceae bacterium]
MLKSFEQTAALIAEKKLLHISGTEALLRKLPAGNWIGGSTEYFLAEGGGKVSGEVLDVLELPFAEYKFAAYDDKTLPDIAKDAYDNGFSIIILPFDSEVHRHYAENASGYESVFLKNIVGWIAGINLEAAGQTPIAVRGDTGEALTDKVAALHIGLPEGKIAQVNIVNIFTADPNSPVITFNEHGFAVKTCFVDGKETVLADYISEKNLDTKLPLVGDYSGAGINISVKNIENGVVYFYAPVFKGVEYRLPRPIADYVDAFHGKIGELGDVDSVFACNCILNFLYGGLEGKDLGGLYGPVTFGEIAWQLLNQTLVYLRIL